MHKTLWLGAVVVCCVGLAFVAGCQQGDTGGRVAISGTVTFQGSPLDQGTIEFTSIEGPTAQSGGTIKNGSYSVPAEKGLPPGKYRVRISSATRDASAPVPEMPGAPEELGAPPEERIPAEWSSPQSKQEVTITAAGPNKFDFNIP